MSFDFHFTCTQAFISSDRFVRMYGVCNIGLGLFKEEYVEFARELANGLSGLEVSPASNWDHVENAVLNSSYWRYSAEPSGAHASIVLPDRQYDKCERLVELLLTSHRDLEVKVSMGPQENWLQSMKLVGRPVDAGDSQLAARTEIFFQSVREENVVPVGDFLMGIGTRKDEQVGVAQ